MRDLQIERKAWRAPALWIGAIYLASFALPVGGTWGLIWFVWGLIFQPIALWGLGSALLSHPTALFSGFSRNDWQFFLLCLIWWANVVFTYGWSNLVRGRVGRAAVAGAIAVMLAALLLIIPNNPIFSQQTPFSHVGYAVWLGSMIALALVACAQANSRPPRLLEVRDWPAWHDEFKPPRFLHDCPERIARS
jgi:hypothetical protein